MFEIIKARMKWIWDILKFDKNNHEIWWLKLKMISTSKTKQTLNQSLGAHPTKKKLILKS